MKKWLLALLTTVAGTAILFSTITSKQPSIPPTPKENSTSQVIPETKSLPPPKPTVKLPLDVPFTAQAPFANWKDPRQQDACEEAAVLMAIKWARGEKITSKQASLDEILAMVQFQQEKFDSYQDTSAQDTVKRLFNNYYHYPNVAVIPIASSSAIITQLEQGNLVITPMNGRALKNPHFTPPGPQRHNIVVIGFDTKTQEFITNDPGIKEGKNYRYPADLFFAAIRDYPTGIHVPITSVDKNMIVIPPAPH